MLEFTPVLLSAAAGAFVSFILMLLPLWPAFNLKWEALTDAQKQAVNVLSLMVVTVVVGILSCYTDLIFVECTQLGLFKLAGMFATAVFGNTGAFVTFGNMGKSLVNKVSK